MTPIYLDHAATTPVHPEVLQSMLPYYTEHFGNPSSVHSFGRAAKLAMNEARDSIAGSLRCHPGQIVFTSGGTESDNTALIGTATALRGKKNHIVTTQIEHHAVLHACRHLERLGFAVTYLPVDAYGQVSVQEVERAIRPDTMLISVMYGNNETGTVQPIEAIGRLARDKGIYFHVDAVQALGVIGIDLSSLPVDLMSFSAHKINGPKGIGALYVSPDVVLSPHLHGGNQERKRRAGTENVAGIVGFAKAVELANNGLAEKRQQMELLRQAMLKTLRQELGDDGFVVNGHPQDRLPHILNVSFPGVSTETLLMRLDLEGIAAASGSACTSGSLEVSHVLLAMGLPEHISGSAVRFSFGLGNSAVEVRDAAKKTATIVKQLRSKR